MILRQLEIPGALLLVPEGLDLWSYHLIDGQRYPLADLIDSGSPLLGLFRPEQLASIEDCRGRSR